MNSKTIRCIQHYDHTVALYTDLSGVLKEPIAATNSVKAGGLAAMVLTKKL